MKTCPYCAEEIQDAAVVCKHCGRDWTPVALAPAATPPPVRWGRLVLILGAVLAVPVVTIQCNSHRRFLAFAERRAAWHVTCDAYRETPLTDPTAAACNRELNAMMAEAQREGWAR